MKEVLEIAHILDAIWKNVYIVWGFCRESFIFGDTKTDIDLATDATTEEVEEHLKVVKSIGKKYGTSIIQQGKKTFEITSFREDIWSINNRKPAQVKFTTELLKDARRRDFSFNAIYYNPLTHEYTDPTWGQIDIKEKKIRFIWNIQERVNEDALRILRFIRFKNKYNFQPAENNYFKILQKNIWLLHNISKERIKQELDKILLWPNNIQALDDLKKIWFFKEFIPQIEQQEKTQWSRYHQEWNVWIHTKMTLEVLNRIVRRENLSQKKQLDLYWTMLFHDISKPECFSTDRNGNNHYYGHEEFWAQLFQEYLSKQFCFSKKSIKKIHWLIKNHLKVFKIWEMKPLKAKKLMMHTYFQDLLIVGECDHMGRIPASKKVVGNLYEIYQNFQKELSQKNFLTGKDIIQKYPHLSGQAIWQKLREKNDEILLKD